MNSQQNNYTINNKQPSESFANINDQSDNEISIVTRIKYSHFTALLTADIPDSVEERLIKNLDTSLLRNFILKVAHHGSSKSTSNEFLAQTSPTLALVSVGKNNYGHPADEVINRLDNNNVKLYRTDTMGDITVVTNGEKWKIED